jgi:PKHD-type hydroxylase
MEKRSGQWYLKYKPLEPWAYIKELFTAEECARIIERGLDLERLPGRIRSGEDVPDIRQGSLGWFDSSVEQDAWIFQRLTAAVESINQQFWNFDLDYIEVLQFTIYDELGDHYDRHVDMIYNGIHPRKLSFSLQLTDPSTYAGSDLIVQPGVSDVPTVRDQGAFIAFPSFMPHRVTPLTQGSRYSLVGWVCGPSFK